MISISGNSATKIETLSPIHGVFIKIETESDLLPSAAQQYKLKKKLFYLDVSFVWFQNKRSICILSQR